MYKSCINFWFSEEDTSLPENPRGPLFSGGIERKKEKMKRSGPLGREEYTSHSKREKSGGGAREREREKKKKKTREEAAFVT